jgi:uncharacterized protein
MSTTQPRGVRLRSYSEFLFAILYYFLARATARHGAAGIVGDPWAPLAEQAALAFLLIIAYAAMGLVLDRQAHPVSAQGWPLRPGWKGEAGLGLSIGWAIAVLCVLPLTLAGGIAIRFASGVQAWGWLAADAAFFALAAAVEEVAFRGYGFQRFMQALGRTPAVLSFAFFYAIVQYLQPGSSNVSIAVSFALSLVLTTAYLRTRALWLSWGLNFAWKASRALLFGLTISGNSSHSPLVQGDPMGPFWLTGGGFGLDGTWFAFIVLLAALPVIYRVTRDLDFRYNAPEIVPGGIPVDIDAAARRQHEAAMGPSEPAAPALVQILPVAQAPAHEPGRAGPGSAEHGHAGNGDAEPDAGNEST